MKANEHSADIKTEVLQIIEAFGLGEFISLLSFKTSSKIEKNYCRRQWINLIYLLTQQEICMTNIHTNNGMNY